MKMNWWNMVPPLAIASLLVLGVTGCVPQPPPSLAQSETLPSPALPTPLEVSAPSPNAKPSPNTALTAQKSAPKSSSDPSLLAQAKPTKSTENPQKTPKTWPKKSRKSDAKEKSVTKGFVAKTEKMTSPNFDKGVGSPEITIPKPPDYSDVAKGVARGELEAQYAEYANNNWKQTGEVLVVGEPKVEDLFVNGIQTHRVYLCLDSSSLEVTESDGFVVTPKATPGTRTALNIYDLQDQNGQLVVANHFFPEDPNC